MRPIFKTETIIYQSKANLDKKNLFRKITDQLDPEIRKMLINGKLGNEDSTFHFGPWFISIEINITFQKRTI